MREYLAEIDQWMAQDKPFSAATVINTWGSAPRPIGTMMFIGPAMEMLGSVSGGCVEGVILREAEETSQNDVLKNLKFGVSDNDAWSVGLTCGGTIEIFLEKFVAYDSPELWQTLRSNLLANKSCVLISKLSGEKAQHFLVHPDGSNIGQAPQELILASQKAYQERKSQKVEIGEEQWFLRVFPKKHQLFVIGAAHAAAELVHLAKYFDFETIVIDPRGTFAQNTHFPTAPDKMYEDYPAEVLPSYEIDEYTFAVVMAHDPKIDDQALHHLLRSKVAYIGALSSKGSNEKRRERLLAAGFSEEEFKRIHAPVGLPIKSKTAAEIALSILAQMILVKNQYL
jgi:xanthine dehydrogenase accessory factor